jgi:hypothetical protein
VIRSAPSPWRPEVTIEVGRARVSVGRGFDRATLRAVLEVLAESERAGARAR